ncbi:FxsB family cyclophane-forming radical SAM/SPASM peptide maturase [Streptomyces sp. NPDC048696]|uniref:FxsB family cyclophane-forming radical SAM/SPASM peptide maturase n=1 Tax=Streptomyces sp. NPDC048696 TaxID=3365585 RepID=UPI00371DEE5C
MDRPAPALSQVVLKTHSRCDLACDHCYVYEHADTSWRGRPRAVSQEILAASAARIADHARIHRLPTVHVVLHGGEPLLAGPVLLRRAAEELRRALAGISALDLRIHTNGVRLDEEFCELFRELGIRVGLSLDGDRASNDRHRRYADGRSSHAKVLDAVALLRRPRYRELFAGLLCTIDIENDPLAVYDALVALDPPRIDFLLPHATWDTPPPRPTGQATPYADWLDAVYRRWDAAGRPVPVRTFESVHRTLRGASSLTESLGLAPADLVVIETDGTYEQADSLKTSYDGAPATGLNVFEHSLDDVLRHPGVLARQKGIEALCAQCTACPVVESCGGGLYAHRYRTANGFDNPSVFCPDLLALITRIRTHEEVRTKTKAPTHEHTRPHEATAHAAVGEAAEMAEHPLEPGDFDELAAGFGGAATVRRLALAQLDLNRDLLAAVGGRVRPADGRATAAWELLVDLDAGAPQALDAALAHPYFRPWALGVLGADARGAPAAGLAELAASAALRARRADAVTVPLREGTLRLPGIGRALLPGDAEEAEVTAESYGFTVRSGGRRLRMGWGEGLDGRTAYWQPVRLVEADGWTVALEDTDPLRDRYEWPVADRLPAPGARAWAQGIAAAWSLIQRQLPAYAPGISAGLRVVTPLAPRLGGDTSATCRDAFGAIAAARPSGPDLLALLIVHEFQHVKLSAVLDVCDLYDPDDRGRYYAPWRDDPRPLGGLLQGTYAHLAVTDFWRVRRSAAEGPAARDRAQEEFARWRRQTTDAVDTLARSASLTASGKRFVAAMGETAAAWQAEQVPARALTGARDAARRHRDAWRARNAPRG